VAIATNGCVYTTGSYNDSHVDFPDFTDAYHSLGSPNKKTKLFVAKYCSSCSTNCEPPTIVKPLVSARDGLQNLRVVEAISQAVRKGRVVDIDA